MRHLYKVTKHQEMMLVAHIIAIECFKPLWQLIQVESRFNLDLTQMEVG